MRGVDRWCSTPQAERVSGVAHHNGRGSRCSARKHPHPEPVEGYGLQIAPLPRTIGWLTAATVEVLADTGKHTLEHRRRELARIRVVAGAVIARENPQLIGFVLATVREGEELYAAAQRADRGLVRDRAQRNDRFQVRETRDRRQQVVLAAGVDLRALGLVLRRDAAHRIGDRYIDHLKAVVGTSLEDTLGKAIFD